MFDGEDELESGYRQWRGTEERAREAAEHTARHDLLYMALQKTAEGYEASARQQLFNAAYLQGMEDALALVREEPGGAAIARRLTEALNARNAGGVVTLGDLQSATRTLDGTLNVPPSSPERINEVLDAIGERLIAQIREVHETYGRLKAYLENRRPEEEDAPGPEGAEE